MPLRLCSHLTQTCAALIIALSCAAAAPSAMAQSSRDKLLKATQKCVAAAHQGSGRLPVPCEFVSQRGFVVMKEAHQEHLFVPTAPVSGVEDPAVVASKARPYWLYAWKQVTRYFHGRPHWQLGLAINSKAGRSQDQLHIHMTCIKKPVSDALHQAHISAAWSDISLAGRKYHARHVTSLTGRNDPFRLVYQIVHSNPQQMQYQTIVVTGARTGFYVLNDYKHQSNRGHGEELLDSRCATR